MLPTPQQLSGLDTNRDRFIYHLRKEVGRQGVRNKPTQTIRLRAAGAKGMAQWLRAVCRDRDEADYLATVANEVELAGSGWQIVRTRPVKGESQYCRFAYLEVTLDFCATRLEEK